MVGIYKITNPNGRVYIGQSQNITSRMKNYMGLDCKKQPRLYRSLLKHGYNLHLFEIIEECLFEELNLRERYYQEQYNVLSKNGMNCYLTETNILPRKLSQKTKDKISNSMLGKRNNNKQLDNIIRYKNGRVKYYKNKKSKFTSHSLVLNLETGIFYESATEVANTYTHYKKSTLMGYLRGHSSNKTNFIYV
jgi:group I intron endonuclease